MSRRPYKRSADPDVAQLQDVAQAQADATISPSSAPGLITAVATVGDLRRTPGDVNNQRGPAAIYLAGTLAPMDGGQGVYVWMPGSTIDDDNDATVAVSGLVRGRWSKVPAAPVYDLVVSAAFSASSVSASWAAGAYRRLELHLRVTASGAGNAVATFAGLGGTYSSWSTYNQSGASVWGVGAFTNWTLGNAAYAGQTDATFQVGTGGLRTFQAETLDATNSYVLLSQGKNTDTTTAVTGITLTFPGSTSGWWELAGYP